MVTENRRLYYGNLPINLHWLDRVSLLLVREAYLRRQSLALCYPVPVCNLPTLAAAQLLIHDFVQNYPGNLKVLLISPRLEMRDHYLNIKIQREPLSDALPLARIRAGGDPVAITVSGTPLSLHPRLYHLSRPHLLDAPWPKGIGAVIVDHVGGSFDDEAIQIHELAADRKIHTVIHLNSDPFAPFLDELAKTGVPAWVWDHYGLAADLSDQIMTGDGVSHHPFGVGLRQFQNIAGGIQHHGLVCRHPALEAVAQRVWDDLGTIQRTCSNTTGVGIVRAIRAAYGTFYTMLQMLVPLPVYEEEANNFWGIRPVRRRIADVEAFRTLLRDEAPELGEIYWPSLVTDLKEMYDSLATGNPKYDTLVEQLRVHQEQGQELIIICPNQATKRMLQLCLRAREGVRLSDLSHSDGQTSISLKAYQDISTIERTDTILFPGQFSYGRRQYVLTAAAPEMRYLAYADEVDRIWQQVQAVHKALAEMTGPERRSQAWRVLGGSEGVPPSVSRTIGTRAIQFTRSDGGSISARAATYARKPDLSLWTPFSTPDYDLVGGRDTLSTEIEETLRPPELDPLERQNVAVSVLQLDFTDGFCYIEPDSWITVLLPATETTDKRRGDGLRVGDVVVLVDGDQRRQLYEAILERVERHPAMGATNILVRYWQQAVREGVLRSRMTYGEFLERLQTKGSRMETTVGVSLWVRGWVLGPRDPQDIRRTGEVLNDEALSAEWKDIYRAVRRVRGLHLSLACKLNRIILQAGLKGRHPNASEECIDQELNLYLDDFRDSVTLHRITAINQQPTPVPYVLTGRFFEKGSELRW